VFKVTMTEQLKREGRRQWWMSQNRWFIERSREFRIHKLLNYDLRFFAWMMLACFPMSEAAFVNSNKGGQSLARQAESHPKSF
jgi:hypothetical protein